MPTSGAVLHAQAADVDAAALHAALVDAALLV